MRGLFLPLALSLCLAVPALADGVKQAAAVAPVLRQSPAELRGDRLDVLFARLHKAGSEDEAKAAESDIWSLWATSDSPTADVLLQQATRAMNDGAFDASRGILDRLIGAFPDYAEAWNKRATLNFTVGKYDESLADIDKVLALEPRHFGALSGRGLILRHQKKYGEAIDAFNEALAINPNMPSIKDAVKALEKIEQPI